MKRKKQHIKTFKSISMKSTFIHSTIKRRATRYISALLLLSVPMLTWAGSPKKEVYKPNWESLKNHQNPEWFLDAKFGIYCHWGPYSVPAYKTEWYSHWMYVKGNPIRAYHEKTYGTLDKFGYKDFIPMFKAEKFNADEWADLFEKAGAKFAGPVTEHADGFAMWDSKVTKWNAANMGPKRDVVGELSKSIRAHNMKFIATFHHHWKFAWYPTWDSSTDASNPKYADLYGPKVKEGDFVSPNNPSHPWKEPQYYPLPDEKFNREWLAKIKEVITKYQPDLIYFDNKMDLIQEKKRIDFLTTYYNFAAKRDQAVAVTYKFHDLAEGTAIYDLERARMSEKKEFPWLTDDSIDWDSWCNVSDPHYKTTNRLIDFLIDVVSKNGGVLLNITPRADGSIPEEVKTRLIEMGQWLKLNGEAIYGTRTWDIYGEGPQKITEGHLSEKNNAEATSEDIRYTVKGDYLYATTLDWPGSSLTVHTLGTKAGILKNQIESVEMIGNEGKLTWIMTPDGLVVKMPENKPCDFAYVLKIKLKK